MLRGGYTENHLLMVHKPAIPASRAKQTVTTIEFALMRDKTSLPSCMI